MDNVFRLTENTFLPGTILCRRTLHLIVGYTVHYNLQQVIRPYITIYSRLYGTLQFTAGYTAVHYNLQQVIRYITIYSRLYDTLQFTVGYTVYYILQ